MQELRSRGLPLLVLLASALPAPALAQHYQTDFPPEEFRARWAELFDGIGEDAVAILQGVPLAKGFVMPRQTNAFYYLSGIETPHAYLLFDGRKRTVTLYMPPRNERLERSEGRVLNADDAVLVRELTGADRVLSTEAMEPILARTTFSKPIYEQAARKMVETGGGALSHPVGFAVHDDGPYHRGTLQVGQVFAVDPQLWVNEEDLYLRYEDTIVVTEDGMENFIAFLPSELDDIEALVREQGVVQQVPPDGR